MKIIGLTLFLFLLFAHQINAQEEANYDESKVPDFKLPEILQTATGQPVTTINQWKYQRRPEIVNTFAEQVYGQLPRDFDSIQFEIVSENSSTINGIATAKEIDITVSRNGNSLPIRLNLLIPNDADKPVPVTLLMNHRGPTNMDITRESKEDFWPAEMILQRGYAAAVFNVEDVADDNPETYTEDLLETLYPEQIGQGDGMMALSAWGWGAMRVMDYFETDQDIDQQKSILIGHSRGGKSSLWTGANDERWGIVVANESGAVGAALSKRKFGETVEIINNGFPYWFTPNFEQYNQKESDMPFDQHMLVAAIAPRGVYITAAEEDQWADPKGMYESLFHATEVYRQIYGMSVSLEKQMPEINDPTDNSNIGYHIRDGEHDLKTYDWEQFLNFSDRHFDIYRK